MTRIPEGWLDEALRYYGCVICHMLNRIEFDLNVQLQGTGEGSALAELQAGRGIGFCNFHFWRLHKMMSHRSAAPLLKRLFDRLLAGRALAFHEPCVVCMVLEGVEEKLLQQLLTQLKSPAICERYRKIDGVCLPHLHRLLTCESANAEIRDFLLACQKESITRIEPLLDALITQNYSTTDDLERSSIGRGLIKLVGRDGLRG